MENEVKKSEFSKMSHKTYYKSYIQDIREHSQDLYLDQLVEQFFQIESPQSIYDSEEMFSEEDLLVLKKWEETIIFENGHYTCEIPFRTEMPKMPDAMPLVRRRNEYLRRRLLRNPTERAAYTKKMEKLITAGHAEKATPGVPAEWTLCHFPSYHPWKPEPRPVFDCAARVKGTSLNSTALSGPNLMNLLLDVFLKFRRGQYRYISDIECMFYNIHVAKKQRCYLRYWWWPNGDLDGEPQEYQLTVHLFGGCWSPAVAAFCLRRAAEEQANLYSPQIREIICKKIYVDDLLDSSDLLSTLTENIPQIRECLGKRGFNLTKFMSNSKQLLSTIPVEHRATEIRSMDLNSNATLPVERVLGQFWDSETDLIVWGRSIKERPFTKRGVLSVISSTYDICGYISPVILEGKLIFQEECRLSSGWDTPLHPNNLTRWQKWIRELPEIENFNFPCGYIPPEFGNITSLQLHSFADGSSSAYGTVHYLRAENENGGVNTSIVLAKSRLKPLNNKENLTIPKTELCAAVQAAQLSQKIEQYLEMDITDRFYWTDSAITLAYINCLADKRLKVYLHNRLSIIWRLTEKQQWKFIDSQSNPADLTTKGKTAKELSKSELWKNGPAFLRLPKSEWPAPPEEINHIIDREDNKDFYQDQPRQAKQVSEPVPSPIMKLIQHFTKGEGGRKAVHSQTWIKLKRAVAWIIRVINMLQQSAKNSKRYNLRSRKKKQSNNKETPHLTADDLKKAERMIIREVQMKHLGPYTTHPDGKVGLPKSHNLACWGPYVDTEDGILKIKTRFRNLTRPTIIPDGSILAEILIIHHHQKAGHGGREFTMSVLHSNGLWIRKARTLVKKLLKTCVTCQRINATAETQKMADLPLDRTTGGSPAWFSAGLDCFGPYTIQVGLRSRRYEKRWGLIISCNVTRSVHIEPVFSMTADSFLQALSRHASRRRLPSTIRSDNAGNFTAGEKMLNDALKEFHQNHSVQKELATRGIRWIFNVPSASHQGGHFERLIGVFRRICDAIIPHQSLNDERFITLLTEIEDIINSRPLTPNPDSPLDLPPLTPNDLIKLGGSSLKHPAGVFKPSDVYKSRWRHILHVADQWYRRWEHEYLPLLYRQSKWKDVTTNIKVNDIVLLMGEPTTYRHNYPLARVVEVYPGDDALVRSVKVLCRGKELKRPINKLCKLEGVCDD